MMSMPFLIFGGIGTYFYLLVRKARKNAGQQSLETIIADAQGWDTRPNTENESNALEATNV